MSNEYRAIIDRLVKASNFKGGSDVLITAEPEKQDIASVKIPYSEVKRDE